MPSMSAVGRAVAVFIVFVAAGGAITAQAAQAAQAASAVDAAGASEPKTLKERLGDKASDEQRVDNCKVPVAERGSKIRPDDCSHGHSAAN